MTPPDPAPASHPAPVPWIDRMIGAYYRKKNHPGKLRIQNWLHRWLDRRSIMVEVAPGVVMHLNPEDYVQREILTQGAYELQTLELFYRLLAQSRSCLDIGGHHGQYTLRAARMLAPQRRRVFTIEPTPANCAALLRNARSSGLSNIDICTAAVSDQASLLPMIQDSDANTGSSHLSSPADSGKNGITINVSVRPFSELAGIIPPEAFDLVKIDVEGYEAKVLASMFSSPAPRPRHILLEYKLSHFDYGLPDGLPAWLEKHGYRLRDVTGAPFVPGQPLPEDNLWAELVAQAKPDET